MTTPLPTLFDGPWHGTTNGYTSKGCRCDLCLDAVRAYKKRFKSQPITGTEPWHGTVTGYTSRGCRCDLCSDARRAAKKKLKSQPITGSEPWHGTANGYKGRGCRCDSCRDAYNQTRKRELKNRAKKPITGSESWHGTTYGYNARGCRCPDCSLASKIKWTTRKFSLSKEKILQMLQEGQCGICGTKNPTNKRGFCFDHDHSCCSTYPTCGKCVRGMLCPHCNSMLGYALDKPEILKAAIAYLERYSA